MPDMRALVERQAAEIERLRAERDQYLKSSVDYGNLSERLRAALLPFARWHEDPTAKPTIEDCERAHAALAAGER